MAPLPSMEGDGLVFGYPHGASPARIATLARAPLRCAKGAVRGLVAVFGGAGAAHYVADSGHEFGHLHGEHEFG